jgi:hypothetical protein
MCHICEDFAHSMWEECVTNEELRISIKQFLDLSGLSEEHFIKALKMIQRRESRVVFGV